MKISVRIQVRGLRRKIERVRAELPGAAAEALGALAGEAVQMIEGADPTQRERFILRALRRQFEWVFIPVVLKHVRREMWPDLMAIYRARILRGQRTWQGRKRFHVDHRKEEALLEKLLARALARHTATTFEVRFVGTSDRRYRVEIVKTRGGKLSARDSAVMIAFARQRMKVVAADTLARALSRAGLLQGRSRQGTADRERDALASAMASAGGAPLL